MRPVIAHGLTTWDRRMLPIDEFEERRLAVDAICARQGLRAVIGFDDAFIPGLAAYLTNYRGGLATVIAVPGASATLIAGLGGGRDHPFIKGVSCVEDVRWFPALGDGLLAVLGEHGVRGGPIGLAGAGECLPKRTYDDVLRSLHPLTARHVDAELSMLRRRKSERELVVLRRCAAILGEAESAVTQALHDGRSLHKSLAAGEKAARLRGCRDVRILAAARYGALAPWPTSSLQGDTWQDGWATVYFAAEYLGYWGELGFTAGRPGCAAPADATAFLDAARSALRAGVTGAEVLAVTQSAAAQSAADERETDVTVDIAGIGIRATEAPLLTADESSVACAGDAVSLRVMTRRRGIIGLATSLVIIPADAGGPPNPTGRSK